MSAIVRAPARPARLVAEQAVVAGGQLAAGVGNLLFSLLAARVLAPGAFAQLASFLALYLVIHVPASSLSAGSALDPRVATATRRRAFTLGCGAALALAVTSPLLATVLDVPVGLLLAAAASAPTAGLIALDRGRLYGLGRHSRAVGSLLAEPAVRLALGVALAAVAGPVGAAVAVVAAGWAALAVAHLPGTRPRRAVAPPREGGATVAAFLLLAVIQNQDVLAANALLGGAEAGRFAVLSTLGGVAAFATTTVPLLLLGRRGGRGALPAALAVAGALGLGAIVFVAISPGTLVRAVFGGRYASVAGLAVPYVFAMALLGVARVLVAHAVTARPPRTIVTVLGATAALHLTLIVMLGHDAGGVATATLIATTGLVAGAAAAALGKDPRAERTAPSDRGEPTRVGAPRSDRGETTRDGVERSDRADTANGAGARRDRETARRGRGGTARGEAARTDGKDAPRDRETARREREAARRARAAAARRDRREAARPSSRDRGQTERSTRRDHNRTERAARRDRGEPPPTERAAAATAPARVVEFRGTEPLPAPLARARALAATAAHSREVRIVAALTLAGLVLRLIVTRGIWLDEATSIWQAQMPLGRMLHTLETTDVHPPLHHLALWVTVRILGTSEPAVRLPSLVAATAMVPLLYAAGRDVYDRRAGLAAAAFATVAPFAVWYAQEARMYALFMLFALLAAWLQVRILRGDGGTRTRLAYTAAAAALVYTQYFGVFLIGVQLVAFLAVKKREWLPYAALLALAIAPVLVFGEHQFAANEAAGKGFEQVPSQTGGGVSAVGQTPGAYAALTNALWAVLGYHSDATMERLAALWPLLMLLTLALLGRGRSRATVLLATSAAVPAAALFALGQLKPFVFEVRYFIGAVPLVLLLLGRATTSWSPRRSTRAIAVGATLAVLGAGVLDQQFNGSNPRVYDFRGALRAVDAGARPGDTLLYAPQYLNNVVDYYSHRVRSRPLTGDLPRLRRGQHLYILGSFLDKPAYRQATATAVKRLRRRYRLVSVSHRPQIRIWEFTKP